MRLYLPIICCVLSAFSISDLRATESPHTTPFPDGTRYLALGDSITRGGLYHSYVHLFHITRFPFRTLEWINSGVAGDNAGKALKRLSWDVFPADPDIVSIMFGMNDVGGNLYGSEQGPEIEARREKQIDNLEANLRKIIQNLQERGIQPVLLTPSIYDDTALLESPNNPGRNSGLEKCAARVRRLGIEFDLPVVDFHSPMLAINLENQEDDPSFTLTSKDRVHPEAAGHFVMAYEFLKAMRAPRDVAQVAIDAADNSVTVSENCSVEDLELSDEAIRFTYLAQALPFPVDEAARKALEWVPFTEDLNQETLTVSGLPAGAYRLEIDSVPIRTFTAEELGEGVNLAEETDTPQYRQALRVLELLKKRWALTGKIRAIAFVEHGTCLELPRPLTLEQVEPRLEAWIETSKGKPYEGFFRLCARDYLVDKPIENEILVEIQELLPEIQAEASPVSRTFVITPTKEETPDREDA